MATPERGAAAVLVCACLSVLITVAVGLGGVAALVRAHRHAQAAADLSALAGAQSLQRGLDPCRSAAELASENSGSLVGCRVSHAVVTVDVRVPGPHWLGRAVDPTATARAGPA
jgi:secretion/DNA translocation related TadE-like protein